MPNIPYCINWVRAFFARHPGCLRRDLGRSEIEAFLAELAARPGMANWRVQQARDALEVYYERFRGIALEPRPGIAKSHEPHPSAIPPSAPHVAPRPVGTAMRGADVKAGYSCAVKSVKSISAVAAPVVMPVVKPRPDDAARPPMPAPTAIPQRESERPRELPTDGLTTRSTPGVGGAPGSLNWQALEGKVRERLRVGHYSYRTEQTYLGWIRRFVMFHQWRKPSTLEAKDVSEFLRHLAMEAQVASSTQNQALNAVVFLYREVVKKDIGDFGDFTRARRGFRLPVIASREEIKAVLDRMAGREGLIGRLLYGTGMRIEEMLSMRVQDVHFDQHRIVAHGKGNKDRFVPLPARLEDDLRRWLEGRKALYEADKAKNMHESVSPRIASATVLRPTCSKRGRISAPCRRC